MTAERARWIVWTDRVMAAMASDEALVTTGARLQQTTPRGFSHQILTWVGQTFCTRMLVDL